MNDVQKVMRFREVKKHPPSSFNGRCPICDSTDVFLTPEGEHSDYDYNKNTADLYFDCDECGTQFTLILSFKELVVERTTIEDGVKVIEN